MSDTSLVAIMRGGYHIVLGIGGTKMEEPFIVLRLNDAKGHVKFLHVEDHDDTERGIRKALLNCIEEAAKFITKAGSAFR